MLQHVGAIRLSNAGTAPTASRSPPSRSDALTNRRERGNRHRYCFTLSRREERRVERMIDNFGDRAKSSVDVRARSLTLKGGTDMFRQMVTRMGLPAIAGLGLLLVIGPAKADPQGWPVAGNWGSHGGSSPSSIGSYSPYSYSTYQSSIPQPGAYYGF